MLVPACDRKAQGHAEAEQFDNGNEATYALVTASQSLVVTPAFTFTSRGKACPGLRAGLQAKGKGEMEMYFVDKNR